jgi:hypothetical protein
MVASYFLGRVPLVFISPCPATPESPTFSHQCSRGLSPEASVDAA